MRMRHVGGNRQLQIHCWWFLGEKCALAVLTEWKRKSQWQWYDIYIWWMRAKYEWSTFSHGNRTSIEASTNELRRSASTRWERGASLAHEFVSNTISKRAKTWKFCVPCANSTLKVWRIFHCWFELRHVARGLPVSILQFIRTSILARFAHCRSGSVLLPVKSCLIG